MAIRVIARIRPRQAGESNQDIIVTTVPAPGTTGTTNTAKHGGEEKNHKASEGGTQPSTLIKIPSPKNENEDFTFQFSGVYGPDASQQEIFDREGLFFLFLFVYDVGWGKEVAFGPKRL